MRPLGVSEKGAFMKNLSEEKKIREWIEDCEAALRHRLDEIARVLCGEDLRLIRLAGPTCSGKTTVANLLIRRFEEHGKRLHLISIDDFYYDKEVLHANAENHESGEVDYDSVKTIDLAALADFIEEIFTEEKSHCPTFDFKVGRRVGYRTVESGAKDVFLFEGIQAVYPEVTALLDTSGHRSAGLYIAPFTAVEAGGARFEPNELRLLRRLVRDSNFRGTDPAFTLGLWAGVRRNEEENIFPHASACDMRIDSSMAYELGVLKPYLERILPTVPKENPHRAAAEAILERLATVESIDSAWIRPDSLYREFV